MSRNNKILKSTVLIVSFIASIVCVGCDEVKESVYQATTNDDDKVAKVVRDQQAKEAHRQNVQWTSENRVKYPLEYLQSQMDKINKAISSLRIQQGNCLQHQRNCKDRVKNTKDKIAINEKTIDQIKVAVRKAKEENSDKVVVNRATLTREVAAKRFFEAKKILAREEEFLKKYEIEFSRSTNNVKKITAQLAKAEENKQALKDAIERVKLKKEEIVIEDVDISIDATLASLGIDDSSEPSLEDIQDFSEDVYEETEAYKELFGE